ncbi:MAG TPA: alpha-amylase family glycosyl hydrolase, partial [Gaiellaceae bacterium]
DSELRDDPPASGEPTLPLSGEAAELDHVFSGNRPEAIDAMRAIRDAAADALLVGEVYLPTSGLSPWLGVLDLVFAFEFLFSPWEAEALRAAIEPAARLERAAWVMSNHDFDRLATRVGPENLRAAAVLLLTLPGVAFLYQGDELGLANGPGAETTFDRAGRDRLRHPMQWDSSGGFTTGEPWLPLVDPEARNADDQHADPDSLLNLYRRLIELRRGLGSGFTLLAAEPGVVAFERGGHTVAVNTTDEQRTAPEGEPVLATHDGEGLPAHAALVVRN